MIGLSAVALVFFVTYFFATHKNTQARELLPSPIAVTVDHTRKDEPTVHSLPLPLVTLASADTVAPQAVQPSASLATRAPSTLLLPQSAVSVSETVVLNSATAMLGYKEVQGTVFNADNWTIYLEEQSTKKTYLVRVTDKTRIMVNSHEIQFSEIKTGDIVHVTGDSNPSSDYEVTAKTVNVTGVSSIPAL